MVHLGALIVLKFVSREKKNTTYPFDIHMILYEGVNKHVRKIIYHFMYGSKLLRRTVLKHMQYLYIFVDV